MRKCILIKTNMEYEVVELPEDDTFNAEVHKLLDCECWEGVPGLFGTYLMVDESGRIKTPPKESNLLASTLYGVYDILVGNVLVSKIGLVNGEHNLVSLTDFDVNKLLDILKYNNEFFERII